MKICSKCKIEKQFDDFGRCSKIKDGYRSECKLCRKTDSVFYYKNNIDKIKNRIKLKDKEKIKEVKNTWKKNNLSKISDSNKKYRESNPNKYKEYYEINSVELKNKRRIYIKNKLKEPLFKLKHNIGVAIRQAIKKNGYTKKSRTHDILGCTYSELKQHIESKFESWMDWDNHGLYNGEFNHGWDIDHIIPLSSAKTEQELTKLNHYTNLQPLCSKVNRNIKRGVWRNNLTNKSS